MIEGLLPALVAIRRAITASLQEAIRVLKAKTPRWQFESAVEFQSP